MFRTVKGMIVVAVIMLIDATAVFAAVREGKVANLFIGAAMVASSALILGVMMDRRLGDAYDSGRRRRV